VGGGFVGCRLLVVGVWGRCVEVLKMEISIRLDRSQYVIAQE
jgi:hypothetical protein